MQEVFYEPYTEHVVYQKLQALRKSYIGYIVYQLCQVTNVLSRARQGRRNDEYGLTGQQSLKTIFQ